MRVNYFIALVLSLAIISCSQNREASKDTNEKSHIEVVPNEEHQKVDVLIDGSLFTSYIYPDEIRKPVLWPVVSAGGNSVTRSFPLEVKAGERVDHPHHVGVWLNYGDVNRLDFWNNSEAIDSAKLDSYGSIRQQAIISTNSGDLGKLNTSAIWVNNNGKTLLNENTRFVFSDLGTTRIIDRTTTLTALMDSVKFTDNKEGMFAIRVTRELELANDNPIEVSDAHGKVTKLETPDNSMVSGNYLSSEGVEGADVWSTRARWMKLYGTIKGEKVAIVIYDHPENIGYPTHWHARTYGLFAANTLGQKVFSGGELELNFMLKKDEKAIFKYRMAIFSGDPTTSEIEELSKALQ